MGVQKDIFLKDRHIIPISGKDSLATALFQIAKEPDLPYEFMYNPTGAELPEVFEWLDRVEGYLGKPIIKIGKDLKQIININYNGFLPSYRQRFCTREAKIEPMEEFIGTSPCFVYYGIRADEDRVGYNNTTKPNIIPQYPLVGAGIDLKAVYIIVNKAGLKPPTFFWEEIYNEVCNRLGRDLKAELPEWVIDILFCWRTRLNCFFCYNQRKIEWAGLYTFHPELFWEAEGMEHNGSDFFWNGKDYPLTRIVERLEIIKENFIKKIIKSIDNVRIVETEDDKQFVDILNVTSCGLLCGK